MLESRIQLSFIPIKSVVIIEIFDARCTRSLGQSGSIRTAINILNALSAAGRLGTRLPGPNSAPIGAPFPNGNIPLPAGVDNGSGCLKVG